MAKLLWILWCVVGCGVLLEVIAILITVLWFILFSKDDGTHMTESIKSIWEDEDEN